MKNTNTGKFSVDGFKKWITENGGMCPPSSLDYHEPQDKHIGACVEPKISTKKLAARIEAVEGESKDLILDFKSDGGTVVAVEDDRFLIEVSSGKFYLAKHCIRRKDFY